MALAEKRICEHTDATTISSADEFIVDSMANGTRNITMTNLENQILSTDTYSALTGIGDGTITGSIADIDSNLNNLTYDSTTNRLTMTGNTAFSGTIDSVPTAGSGNAVSSGGTKTYVDSAVSQLNDEIATKLTLVESKATSTGTTVTFDTQIQADTMYLIAMSAAVTATSRYMRCSMIRVVDTTTNEISFGDSRFEVTVSNLKVTITNNSVRYGIRATLIKLM